jgi:pyrimidine-specific ribonucleoside hydrolase
MRRPTTRLVPAFIALVFGGCSAAAPTAPVPTAPVLTAGAATAHSTAATSTSEPGETAGASPTVPTPSSRTILLDTDVAADDLVALAFLIASPNVTLAGITVSGTGEAHCAGGVDVLLRLLDRLEAPAIPVACGRETPLAGTHAFPTAWREHVDSGSGLDLEPTTRTPSGSTAVELIAALAAEHESLTVLTLGPLTNLADALVADPELATRLGPVYVMGGALHVPGNLVCCGAPGDNPVAEWNVYVDPHAASVVVESGIEPSFVSLDGTNQVPLRTEFAQRVVDSATATGARVVAELFTANPFMTDGSFYLWDALAAELAAGYPIGTFSPACIVVEEAEGPESGFTRPTCETPNIRYLTTVDPAAAEDALLGVLNGG